MIVSYLDYLRIENKAESTIRQHESVLKTLSKTIGFNITSTRLNDLMTERKLLDKSRYSWLSILRKFYKFANERNLLGNNPTANLQQPKIDKTIPVPATEDQLYISLANANERMKVWIMLGAYAGLKPSEIAQLEVSDFAEPGFLHVKQNGSRSERLLPLDPRLEEALVAFSHPETGSLFVRTDGKPMSSGEISRTVNKYFTSLNLYCTVSNLRHYFAIKTLENTNNINVLHSLLGNKSMQHTKCYNYNVVARNGIGHTPIKPLTIEESTIAPVNVLAEEDIPAMQNLAATIECFPQDVPF